MIAGYIFLSISLAIQVLSSLILFDLDTSPITLYALTAVTAFVTFSCISIKRYPLIINVLKKNFFKILVLNFLVFVMVMPLYVCLTGGLHPAVYVLNFCTVMGCLSNLEKRNLWGLSFIAILLVVLQHYHWDTMILLSLFGPMGAYFTIKVASEIGIENNLKTSDVMVLRYILSAAGFVIISPWLPPLITSAVSLHLITSIAIIVLLYNILSIFFVQKSSLFLGHKIAAMGYTCIPIITFIAQEYFLNIYNNYLIFLSMLLVVISVLCVKYPFYWKKPSQD